MGRIKDLQGKKFGTLFVVKDTGKRYMKNAMWLCVCDCGNQVEVKGSSLSSRHTKSCGKCITTTYIDFDSDVMIGITSNGDVFYFNKMDYPIIKEHSWHISNGYVATHKDKTTLRLHRLIMDAKEGAVIDHIDGNPLNNIRHNLRECTQHQNSMNSRKRKIDATSVFKGASWDTSRLKWKSYININMKQVFIGRYKTELEAAEAYNQMAKVLHGDFASFNILRKENLNV